MKVKKHLSTVIVACAAALMLAGCSDYDNGYTEAKLKFISDFQEAFGDIDPEQDWNLAERSTVTVSTLKASEIKIYALMGNEYCIVGDYTDVSGTQILGFDMLEGVETILVSNGESAEVTVPGGVVVFDGTRSTRTTYTSNNGTVSVSQITNPNGVTIGTTTYPQWLYATKAETDAMKAVVPEIGHRDTYTNLNNVTHDFTYVSNGAFVIYPYYFQTSSVNTIGVYYYEGNTRKEVDIYTIRGNDLQYENALSGTSTNVINEVAEETGWTISNGANVAYNTWSTENDQSGMVTPFLQYWQSYGNYLPNATISKTFTGLEPGTYKLTVNARVFNERNASAYPSGVTLFANDKSATIPADDQTTSAVYNSTSAEIYGNLWLDNITVGADGELTVGFQTNNMVGNWLAWKNLKIDKKGDWVSVTADNMGSAKQDVRRGQGIVVNIPAGTKFGMYLKTGDRNNPDNQYFSESELNDPNVVGAGVTDDGLNTSESVKQVAGLHPCYAATFHAGGQMFLGFEDWPNTANESDFDLNDVVLAFSGATPTIVNEDPQPAATWMLACEDLGGTFDTDYNDVVLKIEHVCGQEFAIVTPLAAGGTLASYIFNVPESGAETCLGEIHQLFGAGSEVSGSYTPINVGYSRGNAGSSVTIQVKKDWSMAYYSTNTYGQGTAGKNMGGFEIRTMPIGTQAPTGTPTLATIVNSGASRIPAPDMGEAPYIICLPYSYIDMDVPSTGYQTETVWAWPQEFIHITDDDNGGQGCYPNFRYWVTNHYSSGTWYKTKRNGALTVEELKYVTQYANQSDLKAVRINENTVIKGQSINLANYFTTSSSGAITYDIEDKATGAKLTNQTNLNVAPAYAGQTIITIHQAASGNYAASTITFTLNVADNTPVRFTTTINGSKYALACYEGRLKVVTDNQWNDFQKWYIVDPGVQEGFFWLYNVALGKYLTCDKSDSYRDVFTDYPSGQGARFQYTSEGYLGPRVNTARYFGDKTAFDGSDYIPYMVCKPEVSFVWTKE